ncbi:hypothetical protein TrLO_g15113 [Triparma laevis f. longispina]|uniref:Uncharacterized protein n=1 Tax=Triparma laevis f. longispina TaxID=1714387 RepID=A0A9W7CFN8_9STRA|nr:hypothetical protein TrLO_g15113 [Triparma laevis f. longispina]
MAWASTRRMPGQIPYGSARMRDDAEYVNTLAARNLGYSKLKEDLNLQTGHGHVEIEIPEFFDPNIWRIMCNNSSGQPTASFKYNLRGERSSNMGLRRALNLRAKILNGSYIVQKRKMNHSKRRFDLMKGWKLESVDGVYGVYNGLYGSMAKSESKSPQYGKQEEELIELQVLPQPSSHQLLASAAPIPWLEATAAGEQHMPMSALASANPSPPRLEPPPANIQKRDRSQPPGFTKATRIRDQAYEKIRLSYMLEPGHALVEIQTPELFNPRVWRVLVGTLPGRKARTFQFFVKAEQRSKGYSFREAMEIRERMISGSYRKNKPPLKVDTEYARAVLARDTAYERFRVAKEPPVHHYFTEIEIPELFDVSAFKIQVSNNPNINRCPTQIYQYSLRCNGPRGRKMGLKDALKLRNELDKDNPNPYDPVMASLGLKMQGSPGAKTGYSAPRVKGLGKGKQAEKEEFIPQFVPHQPASTDVLVPLAPPSVGEKEGEKEEGEVKRKAAQHKLGWTENQKLLKRI